MNSVNMLANGIQQNRLFVGKGNKITVFVTKSKSKFIVMVVHFVAGPGL